MDVVMRTNILSQNGYLRHCNECVHSRENVTCEGVSVHTGGARGIVVSDVFRRVGGTHIGTTICQSR